MQTPRVTRPVILVCLMLLPVAAWAQLTISTVDPVGVETRVDTLIEMGSAEAGDTLDTRIRLWNRGVSSVNLQPLRIAGTGFSLIGDPPLPYLVAPNTNVDFRVRFRADAFGAYNATLSINEKTVLVRASSPPAASVYWENPGGKLELVTNQTTLDFGRIERGQSVARRFFLANDAPARVAVSMLKVTGDAFAIESPPRIPLDLAPNERVPFQIRFAPQRSGIPQGALQMNNRIFNLTGSVPDPPPLPDALITFASASMRSGQQGKLTVKLASPAKSSASGTLTLEFRPSMGNVADDAAVQFLPNSTRSLAVSVTEGATAVATDQVFQTGTTAGILTFNLKLESQVRTAALTIPPEAIRLDEAHLTRTASGIEINVSGFDNARTTSNALFTFLDRTGQPLPGSPYRGNVTDLFTRHFKDSLLGGMFRMTAAFPIVGDPATIATVQLEMQNSIGSAQADLTGN